MHRSLEHVGLEDTNKKLAHVRLHKEGSDPLEDFCLEKLKVHPTEKTYIEYYLDLDMRSKQDRTRQGSSDLL